MISHKGGKTPPLHPLFDRTVGERLRDEGLDQAQGSVRRDIAVGWARRIAVHLARQRGTVTADDVRLWFIERNMPDAELIGPAWGAVFRGAPELEPTGEYRKSEYVPNHGRVISVWRIKQ